MTIQSFRWVDTTTLPQATRKLLAANGPDGQELLILVTELTISYYGAHFISRYGCKEYFDHNQELMFYERQKELIRDIEELGL